MSRPCPTLAAACWVARSFERLRRPSGAMPVAIAPEDTSSTWWPSLTRAATAAVSAAMRASSIVPCFVVSDEEPILTTVRGDPAMSEREARSGWPGLGQTASSRAASCTTSSFQTPVRAARAGRVTAAGREFRGPVEDHRVAGLGARLGERRLYSQLGQPVGEVADRLVVGEVGLADPAGRLLAADQVRAVVGADDLEPGVLDRRRADHHAGGRRLG